MRFLLIFFSIFFLFQGCTAKTFDEEFRTAEEKLGMGDANAALSSLKRIANNYPKDERRPDILLRIADISNLVVGSPSEAVKAYTKLIDSYPLSTYSIVGRERRAAIFESQGNLGMAIADYAAILKYFPDLEDRYRYQLFLGSDYLAQRNFEQAREELKPLVDDRNTPREIREQALFAIAESFFLQDNAEHAIPFYSELLKEFPKSKLTGEAKLHMATCVEEMGYLGPAKDMTREAGKDYPNTKVIDTRLKSIKERGTKSGEVAPQNAPKSSGGKPSFKDKRK